MEIEQRPVSSLGEVRAIIDGSDLSINYSFDIRENCPLNESRTLLRAIRVGGGGFGEVSNPDILLTKDDAYAVVQQKLDQLRRRIRNINRTLSAMDKTIQETEEVVAQGGPGVLSGYEPRPYKGPPFSIDVDQLVEEEELKTHVQQIRAFILQYSPGSPAPEGYNSEDACKDREEKEQKVMSQLNVDFLRVKRSGLAADRDELVMGLEELEQKYLNEPTRLGSGIADFVRFRDHPTYAGEISRNIRD